MQGQAPGSPGRAQARPNLPSHGVGFQVDELERKVKSQQDQLFLTRQELTNTSAELKMRAIQAEGTHQEAWGQEPTVWGGWGPGNGAPPEYPLHTFPWASRAPGTGEEEVSAEPGGLGASALQGGASLMVSCGLFLPPLSAWGLQMPQCGLVTPKHTPGPALLASLGVLGSSSPPAPADARPRT